MATLISHSPAETLALGQVWGRQAAPGWVIGLVGELGAGKTQLVKGIALGLGTPARVHSPTFALVNEYPDGRLRLYHLDLYRLETRDQVVRAGLDEYFRQSDGVVVVEWFDRWAGPAALTAASPATASESAPAGPGWLRVVTFEVLGHTERRLTYEDFGA